MEEVSHSSCLLQGETNSVWYIFTVVTTGTFNFVLNTPNDYDFAIYNLTGRNCADILTGAAPMVRCNFSAQYGATGLSASAANANEGAGGPPWSSQMNVTAGQTYVLIVDNWSANTNGYTLTFGGTASIFDNVPPQLSGVTNNCTAGTMTVTTNEPIKCSSISLVIPNVSSMKPPRKKPFLTRKCRCP